MALIPEFELCTINNCGKVLVTDVTGEYDATTNLGGYGTPNDDRTDITAASITITDSEGEVTVANVTAQAALTDWFQDFQYQEIEADLADGIATAVYSITNTNGTFTDTLTFYVYCDLECCLHEKLHAAAVAYGNDPCKYADKLAYANYLWSLLTDFKYAANGCNYDEATSIFTKLQSLCDSSSTGCGCK